MGIKRIEFSRNKKGYFFSMDAFLALVIIFGIVIFIKPPVKQVSQEESIHEDLLLALSSVTIGDINNSYAETLRNTPGAITDSSKSVLDQIGEFYAMDDFNATLLADSIIGELNLTKNIGLYYGNKEIAKNEISPYSSAENILTSRQIISGIQQGNATKGYSSRAFLFANKRVEYFYFGGYVGDGNISVKINGTVLGANVEGVFSRSFDVYINGDYAGSHFPISNVPYKFSLVDHMDKFVPQDNLIEFRSGGGNLYIAGGFIRVVYDSYDMNEGKTKFFPGVEGLINLYDSFYVPVNVQTMEILLHYNSSYDIFLSIGGKEMYRGNSSGQEVYVLLNNSYLCEKWQPGISCNPLPFFGLNDKTVPLRIGFVNASYIQNVSVPLDVISIADLTTSMACSVAGGQCWVNEPKCNDCGGIWQSPINYSRLAHYLVVKELLKLPNRRVGVRGYHSSVPGPRAHELSNDSASLNATISGWDNVALSGSNRKLCLAIEAAVDDFLAHPSNSTKIAIVMSAGAIDQDAGCDTVASGDLNFNLIMDAGDTAIQAACDAYNNYGIKFYSVGYGDDADENTLKHLAFDCGGGNYYSSTIEDLVDVYSQIIQDVIKASYYEQTITGSGFSTRLWPDSYIKLGYETTLPYGLVVYSETDIFNNPESQGTFVVPTDAKPYNSRIVSYSGPKWTTMAEIRRNDTEPWVNFFNLSSFSPNFTFLGDPYMVEIPKGKIKIGNNTVRAFVGTSQDNYTYGSPYNKVIYSVVKNFSAYSAIVPSAEGCFWTIEFEDGSNITTPVPSNYSGVDNCFYTSTNIFDPDDSDDAIELAVFGLLTKLDLNANGKIETKFSDNDLTLDTSEITGIPFSWDTEVQVRTWN